MGLVNQILAGVGMIALSVAIHAGFMMAGVRWLRRHPRPPRGERGRTLAVVVTVLWFTLSILAISGIWALLLLVLGAVGTVEEALYFATTSFTTVGYGDLVLEDDFRLLGAFAATNGMIIFGWTTAMVFVVVERALLQPHTEDRPWHGLHDPAADGPRRHQRGHAAPSRPSHPPGAAETAPAVGGGGGGSGGGAALPGSGPSPRTGAQEPGGDA